MRESIFRWVTMEFLKLTPYPRRAFLKETERVSFSCLAVSPQVCLCGVSVAWPLSRRWHCHTHDSHACLRQIVFLNTATRRIGAFHPFLAVVFAFFSTFRSATSTISIVTCRLCCSRGIELIETEER